MNKKLYFLIGASWTLGLLVLRVLPAHAQAVPVNLTPPDGITGAVSPAGGANYCLAVSPPGKTSVPYNGPVGTQEGVYVPVPDASDPNAAGVLVASDGNNYGVRGSYTAIPPNCSSLPANEQALCQSVSAAFVGAVGAANGQAGFPQGTVASPQTGYAGNTVSFQFGAGVCGLRNGNEIPLCEDFVVFPNVNGGNDVINYIYFDVISLQNPSDAGEFSGAAFQNNTAFAKCDLAHELTHTFGLADIYNSGVYPGLMGDECLNIYQGTASDTYPNYWSPNEAATVAWLNAGKALTINSYSCDYNCPAGQTLAYTETANGKGPFTVSCTQTTSDQISCNCNPPNGAAPYCTNLATQQTVTPPTQEFCAAQNIVDCTCNSNDQPDCTDANGSPAEAPAGFTCDAPAGAVCSCVYAESTPIGVSCKNTQGNQIPTPEDFCSEPSPGGYVCSENDQCVYEADPSVGALIHSTSNCDDVCPAAQEGGYECDDTNQCVYNAAGGQYSDATCDDSCD